MATSQRSRRGAEAPAGYDPSAFPAFAVTVDIAILTLVGDQLSVLLVRRHDDPFARMWALPGGFKRPDETLDEAARRELHEETGVSAPAHLAQLSAYGDPGRDPRTNVVTVAYLAVVRSVGELLAGSDADEAALWPVADVVNGRLELAFDHRRIVTDAVEQARRDLEHTSLATAFVGPTFTLSELRTVFETVWETPLDPANFRRALSSPQGVYLKRIGRRSEPGAAGGRPPELFGATDAWRSGPPVKRPKPRPRPKRKGGS